MKNTMKSNKKAQGMQLSSIPTILMTFAVMAIFAVVAFEIITETQSDMDTSEVNDSCATYGFGCNYSTEYLGLNNISDGLSNMTEKTPLLGTIIILTVVIGVVVGALAFAIK